MKVEFDQTKRDLTLKIRGLDFLDAPKVFAGKTFSLVDDRKDYGEVRHITYGFLEDRPVVIVHVERDNLMRIISMRHAHKEEFENVGLE